MNLNYKNFNQQNGFSLIEVLVSLIIFALGIVGVAQSTSQSIHINIDNNTRAISASAASKAIEPLYIAASNVARGTITDGAFKNLLVGINSTVSGNNGLDDFQIIVLEARDNNDIDILSNSPPYAPPIRVALEITYVGLENPTTTRAHYTFVWQAL